MMRARVNTPPKATVSRAVLSPVPKYRASPMAMKTPKPAIMIQIFLKVLRAGNRVICRSSMSIASPCRIYQIVGSAADEVDFIARYVTGSVRLQWLTGF